MIAAGRAVDRRAASRTRPEMRPATGQMETLAPAFGAGLVLPRGVDRGESRPGAAAGTRPAAARRSLGEASSRSKCPRRAARPSASVDAAAIGERRGPARGGGPASRSNAIRKRPSGASGTRRAVERQPRSRPPARCRSPPRPADHAPSNWKRGRSRGQGLASTWGTATGAAARWRRGALGRDAAGQRQQSRRAADQARAPLHPSSAFIAISALA